MADLHLLLVADDPLARMGLAALLSELPGWVVVDQISSQEFTADFTQEADVIIWDLGWEPVDEFPDWPESDVPVVALLADVDQATAVWQLDVPGLLLRDMDIDKLGAAVQAIAQGLLVIDPQLAAVLLPPLNTQVRLSHEELTPRELEVLQPLAEGLTNKAIAHRLNISEHTVKFHLTAIMGKLSAQSRTEAVVRATQLGLIVL